MSSSRRRFIQQIGLTASLSGIRLALPETVVAQDKNEAVATTIKAAANTAIVETTAGKIRGYIRNKIFTYKGIPYGASTHGDNRFMPPQKPQPWTGIKDTLVYGPISPQKPNNGWSASEYAFLYQWKDGYQSENCLRLNVWSPSLDNKKRPVLFWIHGGGFITGSSQEQPSYDGENLSNLGDVVIVSINHRLNHFGFLDLSAYGSQYATSGNVGMLDIVAALEWVRDNIERFGGDKNNVTIFGQSGGGTKVITLMAMPVAKGLFHKAISQSNSIVQVSVPEYAQQLTGHLLSELNINSNNIKNIHQVPFATLVEAGIRAEKKIAATIVPNKVGRAGWQPVVDGAILPTHPFDPIAPAISAHIPFMAGSTRNEASASIDNAAMEALSETDLQSKILAKYPVKGISVYKVMRQVHPAVKPVEILSYLSAQNPVAYLAASRKADQNAAPVYLYMFTWKTKLLDGRPRSFHCSEIPFVFGNTDICDTYTGATKEARELSLQMAAAWIHFARTGSPAHANLPAWPAFTKNNGATMYFDSTCTVKKDPDGDARKILEQVYYNKNV